MHEPSVYDVVIVGGGPAGLSAGIYAARAGLKSVLFEMLTPGGQIAVSSVLENYPGIHTISGIDFGDMLEEHARNAGCEIRHDEIVAIRPVSDSGFEVDSLEGSLKARSVIYAAGAVPRHAGFEGEDTFVGRGVSYCATCDGMLFRNKPVYVIGSGAAACEEAEYLARVASHVTMVVRGNTLKCIASLREKIYANDAIDILYNTQVKAIEGERLPERIVLRDTLSGEEETIEYPAGGFGVFVFVGYAPRVDLVAPYVDVNDGGITTDGNMGTRTRGLFVAGDVRDTVLRQAVTAVSDGAVAAMSVSRYLDGLL